MPPPAPSSHRPPSTVLVTGANTGIGAACVLALARPGTRLVLACRSEEKTVPVLEKARAAGAEAEFLKLDLADLAQADGAARAFAARNDRLDVLIDNAGLAGRRGVTRDGYELAFGTNHLGHFAFTLPLLPLLEEGRAPGGVGRVVVVSSGNHRTAKSIPWDTLRAPTGSLSGLPEYGVSKLCNVLFAAELRRRTRVSAVSLNPGRIASDIWRSVPWPLRTILPRLLAMRPVELGGSTLVHASEVDLSAADAPIYFDKLAPQTPSPVALRADLARELWDYSLDAVASVTGARASERTREVA